MDISARSERLNIKQSLKLTPNFGLTGFKTHYLFRLGARGAEKRLDLRKVQQKKRHFEELTLVCKGRWGGVTVGRRAIFLWYSK